MPKASAFVLPWLVTRAAAGQTPCTVPENTTGADDGNPHCWDRNRRCDGPNAHPNAGPGYSPPCGVCEGVGGPAFGDENDEITIPACTPLPKPDKEPPRPEWALGNGGKFTLNNDRFIMIGKKTDPFCFSFFPSNNSVGNQCYRRQTGRMVVDMSAEEKTIRYDLNIHIPWPSDKHSVFGNISTTIVHNGPHMWIVNKLYGLVHQCVCVDPLSGASGTSGSHNNDPIFPVMYNWTNHLNYWGRERFEVEYGIGVLDLDHWNYGPHHAWTKAGDNKIVRMWQPYNGFEVFEPGAWSDGVADPSVFEDVRPPPLCKKQGGAAFRIGCQDNGYPVPRNKSEAEGAPPASAAKPATGSDLVRAKTKIPRTTHKAYGFGNLSRTLNAHLQQYGNTKECEEWTAMELQRFQAMMLLLRATELEDIYQSTTDRRRLRGSVDEHGARWAELTSLAESLGKRYADMHHDGHCHEAVMWFVHHIPEESRRELAMLTPVPMLPYEQHTCPELATAEQRKVCNEYVAQVSCQDCHKDATAPAAVELVV